MAKRETKGKYFNHCVREYDEGQVAKMGYMSSYAYWKDPIRLSISAARYKFVSKMFAGYDRVLELGCSDAFYSAIVAQNVKTLVATDYDPIFIEQAKALGRPKNIQLQVLDLTQEPYKNEFDGIYALDVLEHIPKEQEDAFMQNIC
ncbi:MAG: class I SAM-dependent methyltransferase, partial [Helicobacter sp.]|nr:class I SAM-dependent methyltransferase [Helicobacter sp.]